ncbi:zinc finger protein RFP-like isoform X2 [Pelodiscus sinensis]|uniref:zinc finger protein RFP-like isoform X2 n=1 Tax=Pelodiscus sinensis TaxID=13735 RepID=UPI003F6BB01A
MASGNLARSFQDEVTCPICLEYFTDPVSIECGHNFCRACLSQCWGESEPNFSCPQCRETILQRHLRPNYQLGNLVELVKRLRLPAGPAPEGQPGCERHQKALKLFCQEDQAPICVVCDRSRAHRAHTVVPIEEAAQECKEQILSRLQRLREERDALRGLESDWDKESERLLRQTDVERQLVGWECKRLRQFLVERERLLLARLGELDEEIGRRREEHAARLGEDISRLSALISELEEKHRQPALELLQGRGGDVAASCAQVPGAGAENPGLPRREQSPGGRDRIPGGAGCGERTQASPRIRRITELAGTSRVIESSPRPSRQHQAPSRPSLTVDVTLDPDTANPKLILSEDRKSVRLGDMHQDLPDNSERFDPCIFVLGAAGFIGTRCYWEVEVGDKTGWTLGVCRESVSRKGKVIFTPGNGYWAVWLRDGGYKACISSLTPLPVSARPSRVGVFLNYEAGEVSFYNVTDRSHLFTFTGTFSGTLRPFFCPGLNAGGTNAAPLTICPVPALAGGNPCP